MIIRCSSVSNSVHIMQHTIFFVLFFIYIANAADAEKLHFSRSRIVRNINF